MIFNKEQLQKIKEKVDYFEFYKQYLPDLQVHGKNAWSCCFNHSETKPSLSINPELGIFRCFGCGIYGDIFSFYQKFFNVSFNEAVHAIAKMYNVELEISEEERKLYETRKTLFNINNVMCKKYETKLTNNLDAWNYLTKLRGFSPKIIQQFRLGCGISGLPYKESLLRLGLIKELEPDIYGTVLKNYRITIPRFDENGNIVSFTGRDYAGVERAPKYLHLVNTEIYEKSKHIFGLYQAKKYIKHFNRAICVEGELDCIKCHQKGIVNTVAMSGLRVSDEQINLLKKYTNNFYVCVEDEAILRSEVTSDGKNKSILDKFYEQIKQNIPYANVYIIDLRNKDGSKCDPDMYLNTHERKDFEELIQHAKIYHEFIISSKLTNVNPKNIEEKTACINFLIPKLANIQNFLNRKQYIELVSNKLLIPENDIYRKVKLYTEKQDKVAISCTTQDSKPVFAQKVLLSLCFAPNFNNFRACALILLHDNKLEPFYRSIFKDIVNPYIQNRPNVLPIDFKPFFDDLMYDENITEVQRKTILDIYTKVEQFEDFDNEDLDALVKDYVNVLEDYVYTEVSIEDKVAQELEVIDV